MPAGPRRRRWLSAALRQETPRRLLWLPVALAGGIGGYFALTVEPPVALGIAGLLAALAAAVLVRRSTVLCWIALLAVAAALGFSAAQLRTRALATVMLDRELWTTVTGRVSVVERRPSGWRLTLTEVVLDGQAREGPAPQGVRVAVQGRRQAPLMEVLRVGDRVRLRARLQPPSPPVAPGAYDFQRDAYFRGIGAVGFAVGAVERLSPEPSESGEDFGNAVEALRGTVSARVRAALPGPTGAVAAAMLVGDRAGVDEPTAESFRETGLAHLLAISGLHMGLVAGTVYGAMRLALAAWPAVALRRPVKKWAAMAALAAAAVYLLLAGAPVPTQRAFLMTGLILVAVMLDREAITLHLVAWAAAAVLLMAPEVLTGPSFQLSFAAVTGLIAAWEALSRRHRLGTGSGRGPLRRALRYVLGVAGTSAVASLVTAPVVAHHFQQVPVLGAIANLAAVPLTAFVTMPAGVIALAVMPGGWEALPLQAMGWGIEATLWVAGLASQAPLTAVGVPALGSGPLVMMALGGLWLALWRSSLRWLGILGIVGGLAAAWADRPPDALFSDEGDLAAVRVPGLGWAVSEQGGNGFVRRIWRQRWGGGPATGFLSADDAARPASADGFGCDGYGCVLRVGGRLLAIPDSPEAALEDCRRADIVVTSARIRQGCGRGGARLIDRSALRSSGAVAVRLTASGPEVRSVAATRGARPWVAQIQR